MATKRVNPREAPPSSGSIDVRASWIEIAVEVRPDAERARPPAFSLPGIEVQDEWLEPSSPRAPLRSAPKPPSPPRARPAVNPFLGMRMPLPPRPARPAPPDDFDDEAPTVPRRRA